MAKKKRKRKTVVEAGRVVLKGTAPKSCPKGWKKGTVKFFQPWNPELPDAMEGCVRGRWGIRRPTKTVFDKKKARPKLKKLTVSKNGWIVEDNKQGYVTMPEAWPKRKKPGFRNLAQAVCAADHMDRVGVRGSGGNSNMDEWATTLAHRGFASKMCLAEKKPDYQSMRGNGLWTIGYIDELLRRVIKKCRQKLKEAKKRKKRSRS
jgi:hypothetical protein